jgi:hypothetical protein
MAARTNTVTRTEIADALTAYIAGLDAEIGLLRHVNALSAAQRGVPNSDDLTTLAGLAERRSRVMAALASLEHSLNPVRALIVQHLELARSVDVFDEAVRRHREAADLITRIMSGDRTLMTLLEEALSTRRELAQSLEAGGATLAAYRRVLTPQIASAGLVDTHG